jgi:hypothetical protein
VHHQRDGRERERKREREGVEEEGKWEKGREGNGGKKNGGEGRDMGLFCKDNIGVNGIKKEKRCSQRTKRRR